MSLLCPICKISNTLCFLLLFNGNNLGQIARLVYIKALIAGYIVSQQLQGNRCGEYHKFIRQVRKYERIKLSCALLHKISLDEQRYLRASGLDFSDIGQFFAHEPGLGDHCDNGSIVRNERDRSVLEFAGCICLRMDLGYFLKFKRTFLKYRIIEASTYHEQVFGF